MNKQDFVSEILNFSDNDLNYRVVECDDGIPGVRFVLKEGESWEGFQWRDFEIKDMQRTTAIDIAYCLSRAYDIIRWGGLK